MKSIRFSQYKRQADKQQHEETAPLFDNPHPSQTSFTSQTNSDFNQRVDMLNRQIQDYRIRQRLLKSTNETLTKTFQNLKVPTDTKLVYEDCRQSLRKIRQYYILGCSSDIKQHYEQQIRQLKEQASRQRQQLQLQYQQKIIEAKQQIRDQIYRQLAAENSRKAKATQSTIQSSQNQKNKRSSVGIISPKQLVFDSVNNDSLIGVASPKVSEREKALRNENMPRLANLQSIRNPSRQHIPQVISSSRLSYKGSRHNRRNSAIEVSFAGKKNIATDLLCDICNHSYSPIEFFTHVQNCKRNNESKRSLKQGVQLNSYREENQDEQEEQNLEALQQLIKKKEEIEYRIEMLQYCKEDSKQEMQRLQTQLDQVVYIMKNKSNIKNQLKRILKDNKQSKNISIYKVNLQDDNKNAIRLSLGNNMFGKKPPYKKQIKASRIGLKRNQK